jgi:hypothetical protein
LYKVCSDTHIAAPHSRPEHPTSHIIILIVILVTSSPLIIMTEQSTKMSQGLSFHNEIAEMKKTFVISVVMLMITAQWDTRLKQLTSSVDTNNRTHLIDRKRRDVSHLFYELGDNNARRSYRMTPCVFKKLSKILQPHLEKEYDNALVCHCIPNGPISPSVRLSIALRYLAGGQPMDIALAHGVSCSEVFDSIWQVIDAINVEPQSAIHFLEDHDEQLQLADDLKKIKLVSAIAWVPLTAFLFGFISQQSKIASSPIVVLQILLWT